METNKINYITIQQYLDGKLDKEAMHELERQALDDPFLADALEGYANTEIPAAKHLSLLQTQLHERIAKQQEDKNLLSFSWQRLSIAAAAGLLFVTASILFWIKGQKQDEQVASTHPKQVEVNLTPRDSIDKKPAQEPVVIPHSVPAATKPDAQRTRPDLQVAALRKKPVMQPQAVNEIATAPSAQLNEVEIGYGTQKREELTARVSTGNDSNLYRSSSPEVSKVFPGGITGKISSKTGKPLPGVTVRLKDKGIATSTDVNGEFRLKDSTGGRVSISALGFTSKEVKAKPGDSVLVTLDESHQALNEVVVVGYGELKDFPEPAIGWKEYEKYLKEHALASNGFKAGKVRVAFTVGPAHQLENFKIKKGLDEKTNQEAIRLIKEGPAWNTGEQRSASVTISFK